MSRQDSPTVQHWMLAAMLRQLRDNAGLTLEEAAEILRERAPKSHNWSRSKVQRIEARQTKRPRAAEIEQLALVYQADPQTLQLLLDMASKAHQRGWWKRYPLDDEGAPVIGLEQGAVAVRQFEIALVPGLLQTSEYARALMQVGDPTPTEVLESRVAARMVRQELLTNDEPLQLHVILDEAVLRRPVGPKWVMRGQLEHLLQVQKQRNITMQIMPFAAGAHAGMDGSFTILTLPEPVRDVGYVEGPQGSIYLEDQDDLRRLILRFGMLTSVALTPKQSSNLIGKVLAEFE